MSQRKTNTSNTRPSSSIQAQGNGPSASSSSRTTVSSTAHSCNVSFRDTTKVSPKPDHNLSSIVDGKANLKKTSAGEQNKVNLSFVADAKAKLDKDKEKKISDKRDNLKPLVDVKVSIDKGKVRTPSGVQDPGRLKSVVESPKKADESSKKTRISTHRQPSSNAGSSQKDHQRSKINKPKRS